MYTHFSVLHLTLSMEDDEQDYLNRKITRTGENLKIAVYWPTGSDTKDTAVFLQNLSSSSE